MAGLCTGLVISFQSGGEPNNVCLPFLIPAGDLPFKNGDFLFFPGIRKAVEEKADVIKGYTVEGDSLKEFEVTLGELTDDEREIILKGCLINYNRK